MKLLMSNTLKSTFKKGGYLLLSSSLLFLSLFTFGIGFVWGLQNLGLSSFTAGLIASQVSILIYGLALFGFDKQVLKDNLAFKFSFKDFQLAFILTGIVIVLNVIISRVFIGNSSTPEGTEMLINNGNTFITLLFPIVIAPIVEELAFRAGLKYLLVDKAKFRPITYIILSSILFGALHWSGDENNLIHVSYLTLMAVIYSIIYLKTENIYIVIASHFLYNAIVISAALLFY